MPCQLSRERDGLAEAKPERLLGGAPVRLVGGALLRGCGCGTGCGVFLNHPNITASAHERRDQILSRCVPDRLPVDSERVMRPIRWPEYALLTARQC